MLETPAVRSLQQEQTTADEHPNKKMKLGDNNKKRVRFQEEAQTVVHVPLPLHEAVRLWYCHDELKAIHKEIFISLMEAKNGNLSSDYFTARGLEEIRKKKGHKREVRRQEYIHSVIALQNKQRLAGECDAEEIRAYAMTQSRSAKLRSQHYAALDMDEARLVYQETYGLAARKEIVVVEKTAAAPPRRTIPFPAPAISRGIQDSIARSA